jgi:hypothetical protein
MSEAVGVLRRVAPRRVSPAELSQFMSRRRRRSSSGIKSRLVADLVQVCFAPAAVLIRVLWIME